MIVEDVRHLHDANSRILEEPHGPHEKISLRDEVGVEYRDEVRICLRQCMIDVTRFGVGVVATCQIADALALAELLEPRTASIVEYPDLMIRIVDAQRSSYGLFQHVERFIVGGNIDVHGRKLLGRPCPQTRFVRIGLGVTVSCPQERQVQNECVEQSEQFDGITEPDPRDFIPLTVRR